MTATNFAITPSGSHGIVVTDGAATRRDTGIVENTQTRKAHWIEPGKFAIALRGGSDVCKQVRDVMQKFASIDALVSDAGRDALLTRFPVFDRRKLVEVEMKRNGWPIVKQGNPNPYDPGEFELHAIGFSAKAGRVIAGTAATYTVRPLLWEMTDRGVSPWVPREEFQFPQKHEADDPELLTTRLFDALMIQRKRSGTSGDDPNGSIGGEVYSMLITKDGMREAVFGHWPDVIGARIDPNAEFVFAA